MSGTQGRLRNQLLCDYMKSIEDNLKGKDFPTAELRNFFMGLVWDNRDILPAHLKYFDGIRIIPTNKWNRSTDWDNVLGYFDPADRHIKLHKELLTRRSNLQKDLLVALGESLLGRYIESSRWIKDPTMHRHNVRCYEIILRPEKDRECFLSDSQLRVYLKLARMNPDASNERLYRIAINNDEGFIPSGLLFGLTYAWYLSNAYGSPMEYEMAILRYPLNSMIRHQAKERIRKQALIAFFRDEVFKHNPFPQ